jgi:predicted  nucleic acid-binding Zn-ribbon protein
MAREMAEMDLKKIKDEKEEVEREGKKWREEVRKLRKDIEEGRERERKGVKRLEVVMVSIELFSSYNHSTRYSST